MGLKAANFIVQGEQKTVKQEPEQKPVEKKQVSTKRIHSTVIISKDGKKSGFLEDMLSFNE